MASNNPTAPENNPAAWAAYQRAVQAGDPNAQANYNKAVSEGPDGPTGNTQGTANSPSAIAAAAKAKADYEQYASHYEYGGNAGGAAEAASRYAGLGAAAQGRAGESLALGSVNEDRGGSMSMAQLLQARANGSMPSISGMRANQDIGRALADQSSIAASARGPGGLALAQQQQANNSAAAMGNISNTAQINGAQEQLNNTVAAGQAFNGLMGADSGISIAQAQINANQRAENDKYQLGMTGYETGVQGAQLQAQGNQIASERGQSLGQQQIDLANKQNSQAQLEKLVGAATNVAGTVTSGISKGGGGGGITGGVGGGGGGGGGDSGYGAPGSTSGGYDSSTGAPVAGTGGGFDPKPLIAPQIVPQKSALSTPASPYDPSNPVPKADGGPVQAGHPYLVGERGPELIVPAREGHVLTAEQTRGAAGGIARAYSSEGDSDRGSLADALMERIHPLSYRYKDPAAEPRSQPTGGRYLGISAQDLEAVPEVGHQMVSEGPRGKRIESGPTLSAALAGIARLHERLKDVEGGNEHITSDMAAKTDVATEGAAGYVDPRAKAWDEGHNAALDKVQQYRQMSPDQLRELGDRGNRLANAVRGAKADAYDEARGISQHIMQQAPPRQMESFKRGDDADMSRQPPATLASLYQGGR